LSVAATLAARGGMIVAQRWGGAVWWRARDRQERLRPILTL